MQRDASAGTWDARDRQLLIAVAVVAVIARIAASIPDLYHHPDEVWQYLEPAYWLSEGRMVRAWEYREGIRSWLIPLFVYPPIWLGKLVDPGGDLYIALGRAWMVLASLPAVMLATLLGLRTSRWHGLALGLTAALSFDFVYFAPRTLSESLGIALIVPAACLAALDKQPSRCRLALMGLLLGLAVMARYQLAPLVGIIALGAGRLDWRGRWPWLIAGGIAALAISALADTAMGQPPFRWLLRNFEINFLHDKASAFGVSPWYAYADILAQRAGWLILPLGVCILVGARRFPAMAIGAIALIAFHSIVPHKEYRFIVSAVALILLLAAWGFATLVLRFFRNDGARYRMVVAGVTIASLFSLWQPGSWAKDRGYIEAARLASGPESCALAIVGAKHPLLVSHYFLQDLAMVHAFPGPGGYAAAAPHASAFNRIIAYRQAADRLPPGYRVLACPAGFGRPNPQLCVYARAGGCSGPPPPPEYDINRQLERLGI